MNELKLTNRELCIIYMALMVRADKIRANGDGGEHDTMLADNADQLAEIFASAQKCGHDAVVTFSGGTENGNVRPVIE